MFPEHNSYHHAITTREAEKRLKQKSGRRYLTRYSRKNKCYILSINQNVPTETSKHYIIDRDREKYRIRGKEKEFTDIEELLAHYEENPIDPDLKDIGKKYTEEEYTRDERLNRQGCCCTIL